jgi:hypothetical protein
MKPTIASFFCCLVLLFRGPTFAQEATPHLDQDDVWLLVMNIPEVLEVEARKGCPSLEQHPDGPDRMYVLVRNTCPAIGNGTLGNYTVDLRSGRLWFDIETDKVIDSDRLRRLRRILVSRQELRARCGAQRQR